MITESLFIIEIITPLYAFFGAAYFQSAASSFGFKLQPKVSKAICEV